LRLTGKEVSRGIHSVGVSWGWRKSSQAHHDQ
jgi:hypothetical protein